MGPGPLIAIDVVLLYTILGPLVLFAIYALFDSLNKPSNLGQQRKTKKDPALWTIDEIDFHMDQN